MDKIEYIDNYIYQCDNILSSNNPIYAKELEEEILGVFYSEINNIENQLDLYSLHTSGSVDYLGDIRILQQKLTNYKINLQEEKEKKIYDLEMARLKQPQIITHTESNQTQIQNTHIDLTTTIDQALSQIEKITKDNLCDEDKDKLKEYLYSLEGVKACKNKKLFWEKTKDVLKFLADKGVDAAIATLPYIINGL